MNLKNSVKLLNCLENEKFKDSLLKKDRILCEIQSRKSLCNYKNEVIKNAI